MTDIQRYSSFEPGFKDGVCGAFLTKADCPDDEDGAGVDFLDKKALEELLETLENKGLESPAVLIREADYQVGRVIEKVQDAPLERMVENAKKTKPDKPVEEVFKDVQTAIQKKALAEVATDAALPIKLNLEHLDM